MKNFLIISLIIALLFQNVMALYAGVFFSYDDQFSTTCNNKGLLEELSYTQADFNIFNQFIFDSEFKNVNANISVFEEHRNLNSGIKFNSGNLLFLTLPECVAGVIFSSILSTYCFSIPNSCKQALLCNLYSFRI